MILTDLEQKVMKAGNPPSLSEQRFPRNLNAYTDEQKANLVSTYEKGRKSVMEAATRCSFNYDAAREHLAQAGVLRERSKISQEEYSTLRRHLRKGYSNPAIARLTGWSPRRVRLLRDNLRKLDQSDDG